MGRWKLNPVDFNPVRVSTIVTAVVSLIAGYGFNLDATQAAQLTTGVTALVNEFVRSKVTPVVKLHQEPTVPTAAPRRIGPGGWPSTPAN